MSRYSPARPYEGALPVGVALLPSASGCWPAFDVLGPWISLAAGPQWAGSKRQLKRLPIPGCFNALVGLAGGSNGPGLSPGARGLATTRSKPCSALRAALPSPGCWALLVVKLLGHRLSNSPRVLSAVACSFPCFLGAVLGNCYWPVAGRRAACIAAVPNHRPTRWVGMQAVAGRQCQGTAHGPAVAVWLTHDIRIVLAADGAATGTGVPC